MSATIKTIAIAIIATVVLTACNSEKSPAPRAAVQQPAQASAPQASSTRTPAVEAQMKAFIENELVDGYNTKSRQGRSCAEICLEQDYLSACRDLSMFAGCQVKKPVNAH